MSDNLSIWTRARNTLKMVLIQSNAKLEVSVWQDLIDVINETEKEVEAANQWLPFDPENIPEAKEGYTLLIKYTNNIVDAFTYLDGFWQDIKSVPEKGFTYKLVPLT